MKATVAICTMVLATSLVVFAQRASKMGANESKILALENVWNQAEEHKDAKALDGLLADTLVYVDFDGTLMDKARFLVSVREQSTHPQQIINDGMIAHMYGNTAVVTGIYREEGTAKGKPYMRRGRFTDTWVYENGIWQCVASQSTLIKR